MIIARTTDENDSFINGVILLLIYLDCKIIYRILVLKNFYDINKIFFKILYFIL